MARATLQADLVRQPLGIDKRGVSVASQLLPRWFVPWTPGSEGAVLYALLAVAEGCHRRLVETDVLSLVPLDVGEPSLRRCQCQSVSTNGSVASAVVADTPTS